MTGVPQDVRRRTAAARTATPARTGSAPGRLLRSPLLLRIFAWAAAISNGLIAVTGATVRVTGSGLGCETWPECQPGSLVPVSRSGLAAVHQAIEFGNRTLTGVVLIASLGTFVLAVLARPRRRSVVWLAAAAPVGVLFQAVWGGIVVRTELTWWTVAPHMLVSLVLLFFAIAVVVRLGEPDGPAVPVVPRPLRLLTMATVGVLALLCVAGTLVTAAGPHAGDDRTPRLDVPVRDVAQVHADLMFAYFGLLVATTVAFLAVRAPRRLLVRSWVLVGVTLAQGLIGLVQFATGVPEVLVVTHVLGAVVLVATAAAVLFATRTRDGAATPAVTGPVAEAAAR
ncbi:heme A synthase [Nakamurella endophytica]|uniref:Heme A synthase n=2 Tax=Nakamurella endophytica TaxID=1748367 RepID=A0A917WDZ9_9ACTN|nr:heme A synthase [Nakamurella endophytica]